MKKIIILVSSLVLMSGCTSPGQKTAIGAGLGTVLGGVAGAVIGHQSGNKGKGALMGAALGGLLGGGAGNYLDKQAKELAAIAETKRTEKGIITKLKGDILFDSGQATLKADAAAKIDQIAQIIVKYPEDRLKVVGHTDSQGSDQLNASLSVRRAKAVYQRLAQNGVPSQYIESLGMGETQPVASNTTTFGRAQNRRVDLEISIDEHAFKNK